MISKLLTKIKNDKDTSVIKGRNSLAKKGQETSNGLFKSFFKKLQEENSNDSDTKAGSKFFSGEDKSPGKLSTKDSVLGGKFSLKESDSSLETSDVKSEKIKVRVKQQHSSSQIIDSNATNSEKADVSQKSDSKKTAEKGHGPDASDKKQDSLKVEKRKGDKKTDSKGTTEQSAQIVGKEISKTKALNQKQVEDNKELASENTDKSSHKGESKVVVGDGNKEGKDVEMLKESNNRQLLVKVEKENMESSKSATSEKGKLLHKNDIKEKGVAGESDDLKSKKKAEGEVVTESSNSDEKKSTSVDVAQKNRRTVGSPKKDKKEVKAVIDNKKSVDKKGTPKSKLSDINGKDIEKRHAASFIEGQSDTSEKLGKDPNSKKAQAKKNRGANSVARKELKNSARNRTSHVNRSHVKQEDEQPKKSAEKATVKNLDSVFTEKKKPKRSEKKLGVLGRDGKKFIEPKNSESSSIAVKERGDTSGKGNKGMFAPRQEKIANKFSQLRNGVDSELAGSMEKVAGQLVKQDGEGKKSERKRNAHGKGQGRLPLLNHSSKKYMEASMFAGFSGKDSKDSGSEEQQFKWEHQDIISTEGNEDKVSKGRVSSGFSLNQIPVTNAYLRQRIMPMLTKSIKNAAGSAGSNPGKWEKHNFVLDDGKNIHLSVRENKGVLQVKMGSLNVDLRKLLQQNMHQIKQHLKQEFGTNIDLQFSNSGGQQQSSKFFGEAAHSRNSATNSNQFSDSKMATEDAGRGKIKSVRNFGYNQMEWRA